MGHTRCHPEIRPAAGLANSVHILASRKYYEVRPHIRPLQLIPSLRHVWHSRRAQQHTVDTTPSVNRGSQGSTGMVGAAQADDAVTRSDRRKAIGCSGGVRSWGGGRCQLPPSRQCATRQQTLAQRSPRLTRYRWETRRRLLPAGGTALDTPGGRRTAGTPLRGHSVAAPARRLACHHTATPLIARATGGAILVTINPSLNKSSLSFVSRLFRLFP
jgi:hypothetical protein